MDFLLLKNKATKILEKVVDELNNPLSDEPVALECQMRDIEGYYGYLQYLLAWADYWLDIMEREKLPDKEMGTALDREKELIGLVAEERKLRNLLRNVIKAVETRIGVCQSSLKFHSQSLVVNKEVRNER